MTISKKVWESNPPPYSNGALARRYYKVAGFDERKRGEIFWGSRLICLTFCQEFFWSEALVQAEQQMSEQNLSIDDFSQTRASKESAIAIELKEDLERFADVYAKQALDAYKKHTRKGGSYGQTGTNIHCT